MLSELLRFNKWLRRRSPTASTHIHYTNDLELFFAWSKKTPNEIRITDIDAYIEYCHRQGYAVSTINRRLASLRSFYQFLEVYYGNYPNPVLPKRHYIRQGRRLPRDVEDADIKSLFDVIHSPRDRAMFLLMLRCGLRVGQVRNLSLGDLYLHPSPGSLPRLWLYGKNGSQRVAYLSNQAFSALSAWMEVRPTVLDQAVFTNRFGRRFSITGIQLFLASYCRQAGIWITCHQLGHARLRSTEAYLNISDPQLQANYRAAMELVTERLRLPEIER